MSGMKGPLKNKRQAHKKGTCLTQMEMLMAKTYDEKGRMTRTISERKRLAQLGPDYEIERDILEARQNKKAREDAGRDMLMDEIFNRKKKKKGKA